MDILAKQALRKDVMIQFQSCSSASNPEGYKNQVIPKNSALVTKCDLYKQNNNRKKDKLDITPESLQSLTYEGKIAFTDASHGGYKADIQLIVTGQLKSSDDQSILVKGQMKKTEKLRNSEVEKKVHIQQVLQKATLPFLTNKGSQKNPVPLYSDKECQGNLEVAADVIIHRPTKDTSVAKTMMEVLDDNDMHQAQVIGAYGVKDSRTKAGYQCNWEHYYFEKKQQKDIFSDQTDNLEKEDEWIIKTDNQIPCQYQLGSHPYCRSSERPNPDVVVDDEYCHQKQSKIDQTTKSGEQE